MSYIRCTNLDTGHPSILFISHIVRVEIVDITRYNPETAEDEERPVVYIELATGLGLFVQETLEQLFPTPF